MIVFGVGVGPVVGACCFVEVNVVGPEVVECQIAVGSEIACTWHLVVASIV